MPTIVIGGHSRNVGKTSVTEGLIRAFNAYPWTAIKISSHLHSNFSIAGRVAQSNVCGIYEETNREGFSDTSRFLAAGAARSFWMQMKGEPSEDALGLLQPILSSGDFTLIESNRILRLLQPDLFIMVLRYDIGEFKDSARRVLRLANAVVIIGPDSVPAPWEGISASLSGIPQFVTPHPRIIPAGLIDFVRLRLRQSRGC
ncbi:MAG: hypothetical protein JXA73_10345 [Acidobacteria bacterium]|nr:hypothetical protein [Acidobacteriota bacterium]